MESITNGSAESLKRPTVFNLDAGIVEKCNAMVQSDPVTQLATRACFKHDLQEICLNRDIVGQSQHVFSHKVEAECKPVTNQRSSGRCWLFAALNAIRIPFCKSLGIDEFEFSQAYLFFWDKVERCNYFLNVMVDCCRRGEPVHGRLVSFLLNDPISDGGQWDMFVNLVLKYGLVPKKCFPESNSSESSGRMNRVLQSKLREYAMEIRSLLSGGDVTEEDVRALLQRQMQEVYRIVAITVGAPPSSFTWQYYDKLKAAKEIGPITPLDFYERHVKPVYDVEQKVCLVNDPRPENKYGELYSVNCLGNMSDGRITVYNNQPIKTLMKASGESIKDGEAVWFGCEVGKSFMGKFGIHHLQAYDYSCLLGVDVHKGLNKSDRLIYGDSLMTHAMTFTACHYPQSVENGTEEVKESDDCVPLKWRVENSWGEERGDKGYHVMAGPWFEQYVFEVVVDRKYVPQDVLDVFSKPITLLPAWDPMGALARNRVTEAL
ncbi:Peptidase C1B bleomycin hydrolase [Trinorchestia longiramus]|nr:Peptidase C1B bleomycin hydrolase [Trinorchestia longiramus]